MSNSARNFLSSIPEAGEYYISALIHHWLQKQMLRPHVYAFGLCEFSTGTDLELLVKAMEGTMSRLKPSRGKSK